MRKEKKLIPELRFPEFRTDGEWKVQSLDDHIDFQTGYPFKSQFFNDSNNGKRLIKNRDLKSDDSIVYYSGDFDEEYLVFNGDILVGMDGDFTPRLWSKGEALLNQRVGRVKAANKETERFFEYFLALQLHEIEKKTARTTVKHLSHTTIKKINAPIPKAQEQQKIASCLSSLDDLITAHQEKLDALKDHKKGLLQNLFPQEGETVPKVRFPEFEGDGEWKKMELGDLVTIKGRIGYRGYTKDDIVAKGEGAISMSPSNISDQGTLSFEKSTYITWDKYYESPEIMLEDGFTVLVKTGSTFGKVAFISNLNEKTTINPQLVVLKPNGIDEYFLYLIVSNTSVQKQITATVVGGAIPTLSQDSISKFEVMVPRDKEQQKIASCLSAVDELITAQQEKIEELQLHKKGLMQGLFPKIER